MPVRWSELSRMPKADLRRLQDERLARYVREELYPFSAHYRRVFDAAGVAPRDIRTVADLARLPFTTKHDLLTAQSDPATKRDFVLIPTPELIRKHWPLGRKLPLVTGGSKARERLRRAYTPNFVTFTTGRSSDPVVFSYTPYDLQMLGEIGARMWDVHGIDDPATRILNMFPFAPHLAFWQATFAGFETGQLMLGTGGGKVMGTAGNLRVAERVQPTVLIGTPGFVYHMLREGAEKGVKLTAVNMVILGAEKVTPGLKEKMAEALASMGSAKVVISGTYGFTEARMAFSECPTPHDKTPGYHVYPDKGVFEVVEPESGRVLGEGETGELVYTPIDGHGTVVCRYRTGDVAVGGITWEPCPWCGRTVPRIGTELRRASDQRSMSLTKIKGTLVDLSTMASILSDLPEVEEWQVVLQKKNDDPHGLDELVVRISARPETDRAAFEKKLRENLMLGIEVSPSRVDFMTRDQVLEALGMETELKEKRFLDRRPKA